jgi:hypothetical protein
MLSVNPLVGTNFSKEVPNESMDGAFAGVGAATG